MILVYAYYLTCLVTLSFLFFLSYKGLDRRSTWKDVWDIFKGRK